MATSPLSLSDLMKSKPFPAGGFTIAGARTPLNSFSANPGIVAPPNSPLFSGNNSIGNTEQVGPNGQLVPNHPIGPTAPVSTTPLFPAAGPSGPTGTSGPTGATGPTVPQQWLNADGSFKTPDQIAAEVGSTLKTVHTSPDIGKIAGGTFGATGETTADTETTARQIDNVRNDVAVGATDPYNVGANSGIAYTAPELAAIEKAYAGVYDPALDTALAKVNQKQQEDTRNGAPYTLGKDDVRYDGNGNVLAVGVPSGTSASGSYVAGADPTVDAYVKGIQAGTYKASDVPDQYKNSVAQGIAAATGSGAPLSASSQSALGIINELDGLDLGKLSGTGFIGGVEHPSSLFPGTDVQNTQNLAKQLQSIISLGNRQQLKGQGAISDFEFKVLGDASTALGIDEKGRTNLSAEQFKDQLDKLKVRLSVGPTKSLTDDEVQALSGQGYTSRQIRDYDASQSGGGSSFNGVGNTTASTGKNIPQRNNNPGDVKAGGIADSLATGKDQYGHLIFKTPEDGFKALAADLTAKINGGSSHLPANPTLAQLASVYAEDPAWGKRVAAMLKVPVSTPTKQIPIQDLAQAIAHQEGFYA